MVTVSLGRPCASGICSIFPLCMESFVLEISRNSSVASRIFARTPLMILLIVINRCCWSISPKPILIFPKNFLNFRLHTVEKQNIINLSSYNSKSQASVILSDFELDFVKECLVWYLCSMVYQPSWVISSQSHLCKSTI